MSAIATELAFKYQIREDGRLRRYMFASTRKLNISEDRRIFSRETPCITAAAEDFEKKRYIEINRRLLERSIGDDQFQALMSQCRKEKKSIHERSLIPTQVPQDAMNEIQALHAKIQDKATPKDELFELQQRVVEIAQQNNFF